MRYAGTLLAVVILTACHSQEPAPSERPAVSTTHLGTATELFVEYPTLVVGESSRFAAHLTLTADWRPLPSGNVTVTLTPEQGDPVRAEVPAPATAGIFRPELTPMSAGPHRLVVEVAADGLADRHDLGTVMVHPDEAAAIASSPPEDPSPGAVTFLLEQQWRTPFAVETVGERTMNASLVAYGGLRARPEGEARIVAPVAGRVATPPGDLPVIGSRADAGQVMALLAPRVAEGTDRTALTLAVERARRDVDFARRERARLEALLQREAVPERRVLEARHAEHDAVSELAAAENRLAQFGRVYGQAAEASEALVAVRSPVSGTVVGASAVSGAFVDEGHELYRIVDLGRLWLEVRVPEGDLGRIVDTPGAWFDVNGIDQVFDATPASGARVVALGGAIDETSRTAPLILDVPNPSGVLRAGMSATARVLTGESSHGVAVPVEALVDDAGVTVVYVQRDGEQFERRPVLTGVRDGTWVEIREGLRAGERIVTRGSYLVHLAGAAGSIPAHGHAH